MTASGRRQLPFAYRFVVAVARPLLMVFTRREWSGAEHLPRTGGFIVCANHVSELDVFAFGHFMVDSGREPYFLAKEALLNAPAVGAILRGAQMIPVYRNTGRAAEAFRAAVDAVEKDGKCIAIYPEGTITRDPGLWPMAGKTGAARIALTTRCPVIPLAQWGPADLLAPYSKRLRLLPRKTMKIQAGPPVDLSDLYAQPLTGALLREATERIQAAITSQLEELRGEKAPTERFDVRKSGLPETGNFRKYKEGA